MQRQLAEKDSNFRVGCLILQLLRYLANAFCGVSMTGIGEDIVNYAMAAKIVARVTDGMPLVQAVEKTFVKLKASHGTAGQSQ